MKKALFICMGNICRSAMAEGILREKIKRQQLPLQVDSAGTHRYHRGEKYDDRVRKMLGKYGIEVNDLRSRPICIDDFSKFDTLFAADKQNLSDLRKNFGQLADKVILITTFSKCYKG